MTDTVEVCPACDVTMILRRKQSARAVVSDTHRYRCGRCGFRFDEPVVRERRQESNIRADTLAARLEAADPDEVKA